MILPLLFFSTCESNFIETNVYENDDFQITRCRDINLRYTRAPRAIIDPALREPIKKSNVLYGIVMERDISKDSRTFALASVPPRFIKVT